ncbi:MAG: PilT/PilU family type 4a pilus ATPase [Candidatus Absconditabacterales bacterium]
MINKENNQKDVSNLINNPVKYRDFLLDFMIKNDASDMFLTVNEPPCVRVYNNVYRIKGFPPLNGNDVKELMKTLVENNEMKTFDEKLELDIGRGYEKRRFRINISRQQKNAMIVIRLFSKNIPTIDELKLPELFKELVKKHSGIILVAGPTGSGKSTTLAAMIQEINETQQKHIITIEDPIEYVFSPKKSVIEQKQLGSDVVSFAMALRSALRQNPNVILFGEMRDQDSVKNAITLAETGHLVISTIHSKSCAQTINKIIDSFGSEQQNQIRIQLSDTLIGIICQRLMRKQDGKGMALALEIMLNNTAISNLIRKNETKQINNIMQVNQNIGMQTLENNLIQLVEKGEIDLTTAMAVANDPKGMIEEMKLRKK